MGAGRETGGILPIVSNDTKLTLSAILATVVIIVLGYASVEWVFGPVRDTAKAMGLDILMFPGVFVIVAGGGIAWYWITNWIYEAMGGK